MANVLISGATGLVGTLLCETLLKRGHTINVLSRSSNKSPKQNLHFFKWDLGKKLIDPKAFENVEHIVHLAGAGIADKRWTSARKREIVLSRTESATMLIEGMKNSGNTFKSFVSASGANYYGSQTTDKIFVEDDSPGVDFLADCCLQWEHAVFQNNPAKRVVALRTGVVFSAKGGALEKMAAPIKIGFGAALGSGKQYMPWIHLHDLVEIYCESLFNDSYNGCYNAVADEHITNKQLTEGIAKKFSKKIWLPNVPSIVLMLALGEMSEVLLEGSRLSNQKVKATGFTFKFPTLISALKDLINTPE
jgi:uncharacterized protein